MHVDDERNGHLRVQVVGNVGNPTAVSFLVNDAGVISVDEERRFILHRYLILFSWPGCVRGGKAPAQTQGEHQQRTEDRRARSHGGTTVAWRINSFATKRTADRALGFDLLRLFKLRWTLRTWPGTPMRFRSCPPFHRSLGTLRNSPRTGCDRRRTGSPAIPRCRSHSS